MILNTEKTKCETNMTGATAFTIQASAKMFKILSSGLYSNKEKAIIREVSCNAYDANVDAGNGDVPIEVHLPNALEPYFSIKDSGTGLTPDQMVNIYTQYGNSTKTDRNDQIGALGLGSKSPFSYIDSFTVISITDGTKNTYSCYIDGNGEPQLQPFGSEDTDERNGVEVTFPVKKEDFRKFREEAEITYRPFEVKPNITGNSEYVQKKFNVLLTSADTDNADWQLVEPVSRDRWSRDTIRVAVQGNIEYPINTSLIEESLSQNAKRLLNENFRLHFNIGELDIAASREELGYDKITVANIAAKFETMAGELAEVQNEKINEFDNKYEAMSYISRIKGSSNIYRGFEFTYKDEPITNELSLLKSDYEVVKYYQGRRGISREDLQGGSYNNKFGFTIPAEMDKIIYVLNDNDKKAQAVTKARSLVTYSANVILVLTKDFFDAIGNPEYINASEIEAPGKARNAGGGKFYKKFYNSQRFEYQWEGTYESADYLKIDLTKKFYYVPLKGKKSYGNVNIYNLKRVAEELGLIKKDTVVIGVSNSHSGTKKFQAYGAIDFQEFIKNKIAKSRKFKAQLKLFESLDIYQKINNMNSQFTELITSDFTSDLEGSCLFKEVKEDYENASGLDYDNLNRIREVAREVKITIPEDSHYTRHNDLEKAYPLLNAINWRANQADILDYVNGVDLLREVQSANQTNQTTEEEA